MTAVPAAPLVALAAAAAIAAISCALFLYAGALERRGLVSGSRALARRAGLWMAAGTLLTIPAAALLVLGMSPASRDALLGGDPVATALAGTATACALGAGASGLLGGLSGKPRPSGGVAAALLVVAVAAACLAGSRL